MMRLLVLWASVGLALPFVAHGGTPRAGRGIDPAAKAISGAEFLKTVTKLASDEFEGRSPSSKGEALTINYLADTFKALGLQPGNPDGTYFQKVPLLSYRTDPNAKLDFAGPSGSMSLALGADYVASTRRVVDHVAVKGDLVFCGYGVTAPEMEWDDFKGQDMTGKIVVVLVNDPPLPDEKMFGGRAMTYYGRWTYKYENAARHNAAGVLIVHETEPAGYPWDVVKNSWGGESFTTVNPDNNMSLCQLEGWITSDRARELFKLAGMDFDAAKQAALARELKPTPLGVTARIEYDNAIRRVESRNVVAKLVGSDPKLKDEYLIYEAHWDHLGIGPAVKGDSIYNGAIDNATGVAGLVELARAYQKLGTRPKRSILFFAPTAEERGLLGSAFYAQNPLYPLAKTVAVINMDGMNMLGRTKDVTVIGLGKSTLDDDVARVAATQGRVVKPDPEPERGHYYRSDHFSFAKVGVPALDVGSGVDYIGKPAQFGKAAHDRFVAEDYHKPSDEVRPDWVTDGVVEDLQLVFQVGLDVANAKQIPEWRPGDEFKAARDASMKESPKR